MREPVTWDRGGDPAGIAAVVHPGWVQRALTAEDWRGFPGNEPGGGEGFSKVERIAQQIFDKLAELHITYVHEPAESLPGAQRVRAVDEVLSLGQATCLDMCAAFCSAALDAGIYPLLLTVRQEEHRRHALVLVPLDIRWSFGVPALLDEGFSRSPLFIDGDDVRDLVANVPDDAMGSWLAIDVEQATYSADRDAGDWACVIASGASYVKEWDWDVCVDVGGIRAQQDNSSELPTLARTEKVLAPGYLPLPDDSTPLQMIQTRYGVVPFCSRPEYRELKEWAVGTAKSPGRRPDVSVAVLTGAGGAGKTRMAAQLCHDLEVLGWYTGFAPAKSAMENNDLTYLAELTTELLVVVDYAEESRQEQLAALLRALRGRRSPTRIVLTARGIDAWWEEFREELESDGIQLGQGLVKELEPRPDPVLLYHRAVRGFSKVINRVNPPEVAIPEHVGGTALDIVLRAWLSVVNDSGMQDPQFEPSVERGARGARATIPNARDSLYDRVLRLEFNRWRTFPEPQGISLIHLRRIAATLSLLVPDASRVDDVLSRLPEWKDERLRRSRLAELLSTTLLRSAGDGGVSLRPDPVAEHLILSVFGHEPDQVDAVLPGDPLEVPGISEPDASEATVTRAVMLGQQAQNLSQVITRAASQDRESATALAQHVLMACPHLWSSALEVALVQGGPFADALERLIESGAELPFEEIERAIPLGHGTLRGAALAALQRMDVSAERDPVRRARYLLKLANRLSDVGRSGEALEVAREAVDLYRVLAQASPAAYTPDLAGALNNLANRLSGVGRSGEALEVAREAVDLRRVLAQASPAAYTPDLARSLNNLATILSEAGRSGEALEVAQEAVDLYRELAQASPAAYTPGLAGALNNLATILSEEGQYEEALNVFTEGFDRFSSCALRSRLLFARAEWRDEGQEEDLKEAAREADQSDDPAFLGPTRRMLVQALADAGCNDAGLPAWATATVDESVRTRITVWLRCHDLKEQAAHLKNGWASSLKSDRDALAVEAERYVNIPAIGRLLSLVDLVMVEGVDSVVAWMNDFDHAQNLAVDWYSAHTSGRGVSFLRTQLRQRDEDSVSGADQPGHADEDSWALSDPGVKALVLEVLEANLPEEVFTELRRTLELAELSDADIAYAVLASDEDAEDALKELLEAGRWRAMLIVPDLRPGLEEKSIHGGVAASLHVAVSEQPGQAHDLLRSAYRKADPGDRILIEVLMSKASRADDCPQEIADLCAWFLKERSLRGEAGNSSPTSLS